MPRKILGLLQRPRAIPGEPRAAHRHQLLAEEPRRTRRRHRFTAIADGEIFALALEIDDAVVRRNVHVYPRMALAEPRQSRNQPQRGEGLIGRYGQGLRRLVAAYRGHCLSELAEHRLRRRVQHLSGFGQQQLAMAAFEQRHAELFFERLHLARQRRLRQEKLLRRAREAQVSRRGFEALEEIERRQPGLARRRCQSSFRHSISSCIGCGEFV